MTLNGIYFDEGKLRDFCRRNGIVRMSLFGSILGKAFSPKSDIDVLVEFDPSCRVSLFDVGGMSADLKEILGRAVDLRTVQDLSIHFREEVIQEARTVYVAA